MQKWKEQDKSIVYVNDQGEKHWNNSYQHKLFMGKGNIFVLIEIKKKTTTKGLILKPCYHNALDSQSQALQYLTQKTILFCLSHLEWFH